ncbi:class I SAM-dependent methyltransferase [Mesorhizobium sp. LSJC264A00]|uniref:class I SAM-dependent methyltransferase n=1 Tax=unclassified Mesorhizobium TaxID=325217 RepID=UPI001FD95716|nr:class I SAM-dependent methyltransferase [Mesorhizobium sp. LSJC264A00]
MRRIFNQGATLTPSTNADQKTQSASYASHMPSARIVRSRSRAGESGNRHEFTSSKESNAQGGWVSDGYRTSHCAPGYGLHYNKTHSSGYYGALWENIEKPLILDVLRPLSGASRNCLDFACGTGRIAEVAAGLFSEVVGADVSRTMLDSAQVPPNVSLRHVDVTREQLGMTFDVVTAFRFFLNAEDELKWHALKAINEHLKDGGRLVCNVHMNATSPVGLACRLLNRVSGRTIRHTLSAARFKALLTASGFTVEQTIPYGYLPRPGNLLPGFCEMMMQPVEKACRRLCVPGQLAQHFLVVARKR